MKGGTDRGGGKKENNILYFRLIVCDICRI